MNEAPWIKHYGNVPASLEYPEGTLYDVLEDAAKGHDGWVAYEFMGKKVTYSKIISDIGAAAAALRSEGVKKGDRVLLCLPNVPQAVTLFYAVNKIGAVAVMVHPLSSRNEIEFYLNDSNSKIAVTLDRFCSVFEGLERSTVMEKLVVVDTSKGLGMILKLAYKIKSRKVPKPVMKGHMITWEDFIATGGNGEKEVMGAKDVAVILYTGGTTGSSKGVLLSNLNFNATALQTYTMGQYSITGNY